MRKRTSQAWHQQTSAVQRANSGKANEAADEPALYLAGASESAHTQRRTRGHARSCQTPADASENVREDTLELPRHQRMRQRTYQPRLPANELANEPTVAQANKPADDSASAITSRRSRERASHSTKERIPEATKLSWRRQLYRRRRARARQAAGLLAPRQLAVRHRQRQRQDGGGSGSTRCCRPMCCPCSRSCSCSTWETLADA